MTAKSEPEYATLLAIGVCLLAVIVAAPSSAQTRLKPTSRPIAAPAPAQEPVPGQPAGNVLAFPNSPNPLLVEISALKQQVTGLEQRLASTEQLLAATRSFLKDHTHVLGLHFMTKAELALHTSDTRVAGPIWSDTASRTTGAPMAHGFPLK